MALQRKLRLGRPATVCVSTGLMMASLCVARKCFSTSSSVGSVSGSGTLRQTYCVLKLCSSTHFFTMASSFTIFTRDLKTSNGIR